MLNRRIGVTLHSNVAIFSGGVAINGSSYPVVSKYSEHLEDLVPAPAKACPEQAVLLTD